MIEVYKYTHGSYDINPSPLLLEQNYITRGHHYKLEKIRSNKTIRQKFFTQRVVNAWNNLPADIVEAPSINSFKNRLDEHWSDSQYETPNLN